MIDAHFREFRCNDLQQVWTASIPDRQLIDSHIVFNASASLQVAFFSAVSYPWSQITVVLKCLSNPAPFLNLY